MYKLQSIGSITSRLTGTNLRDEINACNANPRTCKLTIDYPNTVNQDQRSVGTIENRTDLLFQTVLNTDISPLLSQRINNDIYQPVSLCLKRLNFS
jgi:hypothetical protein